MQDPVQALLDAARPVKITVPKVYPTYEQQNERVLDTALRNVSGGKSTLRKAIKGHEQETSKLPGGFGDARRRTNGLPYKDVADSALFMAARHVKTGEPIKPTTGEWQLDQYRIDPKTRDSIIAEFKKDPEGAKEKYSQQRDFWRGSRGVASTVSKGQVPGTPAPDEPGQVPAPLDPEEAQAVAQADPFVDPFHKTPKDDTPEWRQFEGGLQEIGRMGGELGAATSPLSLVPGGSDLAKGIGETATAFLLSPLQAGADLAASADPNLSPQEQGWRFASSVLNSGLLDAAEFVKIGWRGLKGLLEKADRRMVEKMMAEGATKDAAEQSLKTAAKNIKEGFPDPVNVVEGVKNGKAAIGGKSVTIPQSTGQIDITPTGKSSVGDVAKAVGAEKEHSPVATIDVPETVEPPSSVIEHGAGFNPLKEPKYDIPPTSEGGFLKVEVPEHNDANSIDALRSPLSVVDPVTGKTTRAGVYERRAGETGAKASRALSDTERRVNTQTALYESQVDKTVEALHDHAKLSGLRGSRGLRKTYSDFIDLVEKPYADPGRQAVLASDTPLGEALRAHDSLTGDIRDYIVESRRNMGIETPDDWGITDQGYYRHMFFGNIEMKVLQPDGTWKLVGTAKTYPEAMKMGADILSDDMSAKIRATPRNFTGGDPSVRVSNKRYWQVVKELVGSTGLTEKDIIEDIQGKIGRNASKRKFLGSLLHRTGAEGFSRDYADVMRITAAQSVRAQELSQLQKTVAPLIEQMKSAGKRGTADMLQGHMDALWGTPTAQEVRFGNFVRNIPHVGSRVAMPDMAMRQLAQRLNSVQYFLKLRFSVKGGLVNALQPMQTLLPFISTKEYAKTYAKAIRPSTLKALEAKGVLDFGGKLEQGVHGKLAMVDVFQPASKINRAVGYTYGYDDAIRRGADDATAHAAGLEWAKRVEFDSTKWGVQPALRTPGGKTLGQFKGFTGKAFENLADVWRKGDEKNAMERFGRIAKYHGGLALAGGTKAALSPANYLAVALVTKLYTDMKSQGMSDDDATQAANGVLYGAPGLLGGDISSSLTIGDLYGGSPLEIVANTVLGPTVGTATTVAQGLKDYFAAKDGAQKTAEEKRWTVVDRTMRKVTPLWRQGQALKAMSEGRSPTYKKERKDVEPQFPLAKWLMSAGIVPVEQSSYYDYKKGSED